MTESECENYAESFVEHKYCTGQPLVAQDTCQVKNNCILAFDLNVFKIISWTITKGDSGGGMYCLKKDKKFYAAGYAWYLTFLNSCSLMKF